MPLLDESRINSKIKASLGVQHIRIQIQQAEAELERADAALADLPAGLRRDLLSRHDDALQKLYDREKALVAQARRAAERELRDERLESLRIEAAPLLERASKNLEIMKADLAKVARIEAEARTNGGRVMSEAFDQTLIDFFIPTLSYSPASGTWAIKR